LLTAGGSLFQTAAQVEADMRYQRSVADDDGNPATYLSHADHSQQAAKFFPVHKKTCSQIPAILFAYRTASPFRIMP
jgi:hypothetical protein